MNRLPVLPSSVSGGRIVYRYDAEVRVPVCDRGFHGCLEAVKAGYRAMHPRISFGGNLIDPPPSP